MSVTPHTTADRIEPPPALARLLEWARPRSSRLAWIALAVMLVATAGFLWHLTRQTTFWFDEWQWVLYRRGNNPGTFLTPHNEHLSLVPVAIYKFLFATVGIDDYRPYRALVIAGHLTCSALVFVYARRRVGDLLGLLAAALLLFLGPAWQDIIWPFQIAWLISLVAGVGAFLMLDRADRVGDLAACGLLALAIASSGLGLPLAVGMTVEVLWGRHNLRSAWIVLGPLALYGIWWLAYHSNTMTGQHWRHDLVLIPPFVAAAAAAAVASVAGLAGPTGNVGPQSPLDFGAPLLAASVALVAWRLVRLRPVPTRVLALLAAMFSFWTLTAIGRAWLGLSAAYQSRYLYVGGIFLILLAVELLRGVSLPRLAAPLLALAVAAAAISNIGAYRVGAAYVRNQAKLTRADLGALDITRGIVSPGYVSTVFPGVPFVTIRAAPYFSAERALGTPAATPAELAAEPEVARMDADTELVEIHQVRLGPGGAAAAAPAPTVESAAGGAVSSSGGCVSFQPAPATAGVSELRIAVPASGVLVKAEGGATAVAVRRFADEFHPLGNVPAGVAAGVRIGPDRAP
jgi:hypothetical protein